MEIEVRTQGRSCHGSAPERGVNAVYKMAPIVLDIERLNDAAGADGGPVSRQGLGHDRRDPLDVAVAVRGRRQLHDPPRPPPDRAARRSSRPSPRSRRSTSVRRAGATVTVLDYARAVVHRPGLPDEEVLPDLGAATSDHPAVARRSRRRHGALGRAPAVGKWVFSTNGIATCGMFGIPTVGFGPGNEMHAHTPDDQCPVEHLTRAARVLRRCSRACSSSERTR